MMEQTNSLNLRYFKAKEEDRQEFFMTNIITIKEIIRIGTDQVVEIGEFHLVVEFSVGKNIEIDQDMNKAIGTTFIEKIRGNVRMYQNQSFRRQNNRSGYRRNYRNENYERVRSKSRERQYQGNIRRNDRSSSRRSRSGSRLSTNRDRIRCYMCREYDHFTKDCLKPK